MQIFARWRYVGTWGRERKKMRKGKRSNDHTYKSTILHKAKTVTEYMYVMVDAYKTRWGFDKKDDRKRDLRENQNWCSKIEFRFGIKAENWPIINFNVQGSANSTEKFKIGSPV